MKFSLRSQMLVAILGPPFLAGAYLLLRHVMTATPPSGAGWLDLLITRDLLLVMVIVALGAGWRVERQARIREEGDAQLLILELEIELANCLALQHPAPSQPQQ